MLNYLFRRLNLLLITTFILTIIAFALTYWSTYEQTSESSNLVIDYLEYIFALLQGDWGISSIDLQPILHKGVVAFASTLELCFMAFVVANIIAMPLGIFAALNRNNLLDYIIMTLVLIGQALPVFWLALISTMLPELLGLTLPIDRSISQNFEIPQVSGFLLLDTLLAADTYRLDAFISRLLELALPSSVLAFFLITEITRLTRHSITTVMKSNYIKAAYAKGLSSRQIVLKHVIKNALPSIIHQVRLQLSTIFSFAMVIEIVFSIQGAGTWLFLSIQQCDYLALPAAVLLIAGFILLTSIFIDILLVAISPVKRKSIYDDY